MTASPGRRGGHRHTAAIALATAAFPLDASAHLISTGLGPLYDGVVHFAISPEAVLSVVALAIVAGLRGAAHARAAVLLLTPAWVVSGALGMIYGPLPIGDVYKSAPLIILGGLAAADIPMRPWVTGLLALLLGFFQGFAFDADSAATRDGVLALLATVAAAFVTVSLASAAVLRARHGWPRVAVRVAGSWTAASGLLLLGWGLR